MREFRGITIDAVELVRSLGQLDELRARARPMDGEDIGRPLSENELRAVWSSSKGLKADFPSILLGSQSVLADFLPRILALPGGVVPATSLMRAWSIEDFKQREIHGEKPLSDAAALGFVGLIMGELLTTLGSDADLRLMGMDGVRRTLSFVCAQAAAGGWRNEALATIAQRWLEASELTANEVNVPALVQIANISGFLRALSDVGQREDSTPQALANHVQSWIGGRRDPNQRDLLLQHSLAQIAQVLTGVNSREKRYDLVMEALGRSSRDEMRDPLERGFLISLIEPGSFEFLEFAMRADPRNGSVATAYCVCAAILGKEAALRNFSGFGWSVLNHGFRVDIDTPIDISIAELRILHNARRSAPIPFRTRSPWLVDVELAPMVIGSFGNVAKRRVASQRAEEEPGSSARDELLRERLVTALRALDDAYGLVQGKRPGHDDKAGAPRRQRR